MCWLVARQRRTAWLRLVLVSGRERARIDNASAEQEAQAVQGAADVDDPDGWKLWARYGVLAAAVGGAALVLHEHLRPLHPGAPPSTARGQRLSHSHLT